MAFAVDTVLVQQLQGDWIHGMPCHGAQTGTGDRRAVARPETVSEQVLGGGTSTDVADAGDQYVLEHGMAIIDEGQEPRT
jgi:hypothetical protein